MALKDCHGHPFCRTLLCMLAAETKAKYAPETELKELVEDD